ncbi:hypothetical protein ACIQGZ_01615 [Streptomyces sp. NPDC092296]|uniref:hypothetical protein n=1 Tax=Streptomyces sp. NPDC092296 TaxID=3366012 RepID=UPI0037F5BAF5
MALTPRRRGRAALGAAALLGGGALLVAGCSSGSGTAAAPASAAATGQAGAGQGGDGQGRGGGPGGAFAEYAQCLQQNGYTLPSRPSGMPRGSGRPEAWGSGRPSAWPSGRPSNWPSGRPSAWPSGRPGGREGGGFGMGMGNTADPAYQKAAAACKSKLPSFGGGRGGNGGGNGSAESSALKAFADCMRGKGVTVTNGLAGLATSDPKTAAALKTCRPLLPESGSAPTPNASPTT